MEPAPRALIHRTDTLIQQFTGDFDLAAARWWIVPRVAHGLVRFLTRPVAVVRYAVGHWKEHRPDEVTLAKIFDATEEMLNAENN